MTTTHYLPENADVLGTLTRRGVSVPPHLTERLASISAKTHNNYVGYYQFRDGATYHRLLVVPKIFDDPTTYEVDFVRLLKRYVQINARHGSPVDPLRLEGNVLDLVFAPQALDCVQTVPEFLELSYREALRTLRRFLRRTAPVRRTFQTYTAPTLRHRIDVPQNVRRLDKSQLAQTRPRDPRYAALFAVLRAVHRHFLRHRLPHLEAPAQLRTLALHNLRTPALRSTAADFRFRVHDLPTQRIRRLFRGSNELRLVYRAALQLSGAEQFIGAGLGHPPIRLDGMTALFFRPEQLYEWLVYDALLARGWTVARQDGRAYTLFRDAVPLALRESRPDFIARRGAQTVLVDAKWKVLRQPADLEFGDIAKLERDWRLRRDEVTQCWLVYPKIAFEGVPTAELRRAFDAAFSFQIREVF